MEPISNCKEKSFTHYLSRALKKAVSEMKFLLDETTSQPPFCQPDLVMDDGVLSDPILTELVAKVYYFIFL